MKRFSAMALVLAFAVLALQPLKATAQEAGAGKDDLVGKGWLLSLGGKLYDNQWMVLNTPPPAGRNPVYPAGAAIAAASTWRCVACHGWDYRGREGHLKRVMNSPKFVSLSGVVGKKPEEIAGSILGGSHGRIGKALPRPMLMALSFFLARGQHDVTKLLDAKGRSRGKAIRGKDIFEGACISCHQADGKAFIEGEEGDRPALGWVTRHRPEQALHKIRNGVPGADMLSLRFLTMQQVADLLAYLQTLDPNVASPEAGSD